MKNRKIRLIIGMLVGLVFFSSSIALLLYIKQDTTPKVETVDVYVTSRNISKGEKITVNDIHQASLPKSYVTFTPLVAAEIVGHYVKIAMFADEPLRAEKLSSEKPEEKVVATKQTIKRVEKKVESADENLSQYDNNKDTLTMPLSLFKNIDESLKAGDFIDIVTVVPKKNSKENGFDTKYVAVHLLINSFVSNTQRINRVVSVGKEGAITRANAVVFDILPGDVKNILATYYKTQVLNMNNIYNTSRDNRGHLWMIKSTSKLNPEIQKYKKKMLVDHVPVYKKKKRKKKVVEKVSISYED